MKAQQVLSLGFDETRWEFTSQGKYLLVRDPRGLYQVYHPWDLCSAGDFGAISTTIKLPAGWSGPVLLNLYAADTYQADGWEKVKPTWTHSYAACYNLVGHRFKQALIDNKVVWEQDVADTEDFGYTSIDITKHVKPGKSFALMLRVIDKVDPATKLPGDECWLGIWDWQALGDKDWEKKFYTRVFWGDIALSGTALPWDKNPARVETPLSPIKTAIAEPDAHTEAKFTLNAPDGLPEDGYPVTWGVPFAQGRLPDGSHVSLADASGKPVPLQTQTLHKWPDGSIHWLLLDFQAGAANAGRSYTLTFGSQVAPTPTQPGLVVSETADGVSVDTGALTFAVTKKAKSLAQSFTLSGERTSVADRLAGMVKSRDGWEETEFTPINDTVTVEASGPERATVAIAGKLMSQDKAFGRFTCRIHAYRSKPYVRVLYRIFNDTDIPAQLVSDFSLRLQTPFETGEAVLGDQKLETGPAENQRLLVRQAKCDAYAVIDGSGKPLASGGHWTGPISLQTPEHGVSGAVRHFAQLYPKRMWAGQGGQMVFDLFAITIEYEHYVMTKGEAKRHEMLLCFHRGEGDQPGIQAAFKAFETPPILISPEWYGNNQAFGRGAPLTDGAVSEINKQITANVPSLNCYQPQGIHNWPDAYGDSVYNAYRGTWNNMYQEVDYGSYIVGTLAGRREWIDYARAYQEHFMDIDICHHSSDQAFVGASYGVSPNHTGHEPYSLNAPLGGLFLLYSLTGDPDARESAVGIADWIYRANMGLGQTSGRAVGWPLRSSMIAYENTGDKKHLEAGERLAAFALTEAMPRRGFFTEPGTSWQYRGGVPSMNSILMAGLMRYWRASGDERVGRLCSDMAYNMAYSWMSPTEPGLILGSNPLQSLDLVGYAMQDVTPLFWGYELTGDKTFLEKGLRMMEVSIMDEKRKGAAFGLSRYWEMQDILYYYALAKKMGK